jgi:hypothetical protein
VVSRMDQKFHGSDVEVTPELFPGSSFHIER